MFVVPNNKSWACDSGLLLVINYTVNFNETVVSGLINDEDGGTLNQNLGSFLYLYGNFSYDFTCGIVCDIGTCDSGHFLCGSSHVTCEIKKNSHVN